MNMVVATGREMTKPSQPLRGVARSSAACVGSVTRAVLVARRLARRGIVRRIRGLGSVRLAALDLHLAAVLELAVADDHDLFARGERRAAARDDLDGRVVGEAFLDLDAVRLRVAHDEDQVDLALAP